MKSLEKKLTENYIRKLSDGNLLNTYKITKDIINHGRNMRGFAFAEDIEYKYLLLKEINKRGLAYYERTY